MTRVAALDLGTNTFRILVAEVREDYSFEPLRKDQIITRLGGGYDNEENIISAEAMERALRALNKFARIIADEKAETVYAQATEIVRRATNGDDFIERAASLGIKVEKLSARMEAALALRGILAYNPPVKGPFVTLDVGGGSTELSLVENARLKSWVSLRLGVVDLSERVMGDDDPPTESGLAACEREIGDRLDEAFRELGRPAEVEAIIGTGGTATSLAIVDLGLDEYDEDAVQNSRLSLEKVAGLEKWLASISFEARSRIFPLGGGREDVIIPGAMITRVAMETFGTEQMLVSDAGLLEGLVLAGADKIFKKEVKEE